MGKKPRLGEYENNQAESTNYEISQPSTKICEKLGRARKLQEKTQPSKEITKKIRRLKGF